MWIVMVAVGEYVGDRRTDLVAGGLHQAEEDVLGGILDAEVVLCDPALGGEDLDGAGVGELGKLAVWTGDADIAKAHRLR